MTEAEWLAGDDPKEMSVSPAVVRGSPRKLRLFAVACARRLPADLLDDDCRRCLDAAEGSADGRVSAGDRRRAAAPVAELVDRLDRASRAAGEGDPIHRANHAALACYAAAGADRYFVRETADLVLRAVADRESERRHQCAVLRDIYGNPFRPPAFDPRWRTADAVGLARGIYEAGAFDRLPLLADALMDAGCDSEEILAHCRGDGSHVRGCWAVDLVLGKE